MWLKKITSLVCQIVLYHKFHSNNRKMRDFVCSALTVGAIQLVPRKQYDGNVESKRILFYVSGSPRKGL